MPVVVRVLFSAAGQLAQMIFGGGKGYNDAQIRQAVNDSFLSSLHATAVVAWALEGLTQMATNARGAGVNTVSQLGGAIAEHQIAMRHIVDTIIPDSTHHATGRYHNATIAPLERRLKAVEGMARQAANQVNTLRNWRKFTVDPYMPWLAKFSRNVWPAYKPWIDLVAAWVHDPAGFANYFAPPFAGALVNYWADDTHKPTRDALMLIITRAMQEAPQDVLVALDQWLVTDN